MSPIGVNVSSSVALTGGTIPTNGGTAFFAGLSDQGPLTATLCPSLARYKSVYGARSTNSAILYDSVETFFREGGRSCYIVRVSDNTATTATLTLQDVTPHPTVVVNALTPGLAGNTTYVKVTVASSKFTILIQDANGNTLETWGPYSTTAALYANATTSAYVTFSQSAGSGFTTVNPAALSATALSGGADLTDVSDALYVSSLAVFGPELGPGQVAVPGGTTTTIWAGLLAHAQANDRFALLDTADAAAASVVTAIASLRTASNGSYGGVFASQCLVPGVVPGTTRTVPASAAVAGLCARVHATGNDNQAPAGVNWPLQFVTGFTQNTGPLGGYSIDDLNVLYAGGANGFTVRYGVPCLFGFSTPIAQNVDVIYWSAAAARERMMLIAAAKQAVEPFAFQTIDGKGVLLAKLSGVLSRIISDHWVTGALYGDQATDAGSVDLSGNSPGSEQSGVLVAVMNVRISPFAEEVDINVASIPITQNVLQAA